MAKQLLDRQLRLLEYLTSGRAIFGDRRGTLDPALKGIDRGLLDLEARFSHEKRMEKVGGVFPATLALLGTEANSVIRDFAEACPPHDISRIENARQFHAFLIARCAQRPGMPLYLADMAACELACAEARLVADTVEGAAEPPPDVPRPAIRRNPVVVILRTAFDIRGVFEDEGKTVPDPRETCLAIAWAGGRPHTLELPPEVFEVLSALERWTALANLPDADDFAADLVQAGLLELCR